MAFRYDDGVLETTTTTGTGAVTLAGAVTGFKPFSGVSGIVNGDTVPYVIFTVDGNGNRNGAWESGTGTYNTAGNTLTRTTVDRSSNANAAVNFAAGTKRVALSVNQSLVRDIRTGIENAGSPAITSPGTIIDQSINGTAHIAYSAAVNRIELSPLPMVFYDDIIAADIGVTVTTVGAGSIKILVYEANDDTGEPTNKVYESGVISVAAAVYVGASPAGALIFKAGKRYWVGVWYGVAVTLRGIPVAGLKSVGVTQTGAAPNTVLRRVSIGLNSAPNTAPNPWVYSAAEAVATNTPSIRITL